MKLLAFLAVIAGVLALGTAQLQVTSAIQTRNAEGLWTETLLGPSGFETSGNSQTANRLVVRGAEGVWHSPLGAPAQFNVQSSTRILVRNADSLWTVPLSTPNLKVE
jgi:hypothetical protein